MPRRAWAVTLLSAAVALCVAALGACSSGSTVTCGGKTCAEGERCCGTAACGFCVPAGSEVACKPAPCNEASTPRDARGESSGVACGGAVCGKGSFCCGPPACGHCAPEGSGVYCPSQCPEAGPDR